MTWREKDHPRDGDGRFTDSWAGAVADRLFPERAHGRNLVAEGYDFTEAASKYKLGTMSWSSESYDGDQALSHLYTEQGYHGLPEVVSRAEMDQIVQQPGYIELFRGVKGESKYEGDLSAMQDRFATMRQQTEQFRRGEIHHPGWGARGNGTYTTDNEREGRGYTASDPSYLIGGPDDDRPNRYHALDPIRWPGFLRMALRPDARVITSKELDRIITQHLDDEGYAPDPAVDPRGAILTDEGRLAAALGYDAIHVERSAIQHYVILNRTAVVVEEGAGS